MPEGLPQVCVVYLIRQRGGNEEVLLGEKRIGLGEGKVVAPGGKLEAGEDSITAAIREVWEEVGLRVDATALSLVGDFTYLFPTKPAWSQRSWAFIARGDWGAAVPSAELHATWIVKSRIPFDRMWDDARLWLPTALNGTFFAATFEFGPDLSTVVRSSLDPS